MNKSPLGIPAARQRALREKGSAIIIVIMSLAVLVIVAGTLLSYTTSKQAAPFQAQSWQEAGTAAEGGVELALNALRRSLDEGTSAWNGWSDDGTTTYYKKFITADNLLGHTGEGNTDVRAVVEVTKPSGVGTVNPPEGGVALSEARKAYVIRSTGIANLSGPNRLPLSKPDQSLRKMNFIADFRTKQKVQNGRPQVARVIEAVASPVTPFPLAIHAREQLDMTAGAVAVTTLPLPSDAMRVDSYDPTLKPVRTWGNWKTDYIPVQNSNGAIATNGKKDDIIRLEKVAVLGNVAKGGGLVNIKTPGAMVTGETIDKFYRELKSIPYPGTAFVPTPGGPTGKAADRPNGSSLFPKTVVLTAGSPSNSSNPNPPSTFYKLDKIHLHDGEKILIKKQSSPGVNERKGTAEIWVTGDMVLHKGGRIEVENGANAIFYCEKNVTLEEKDEGKPAILNDSTKIVDSTNEVSKKYTVPDPASLQFYGVLPKDQKPKKKKFKIKGNLIGLVYAPDHEFEIKLKKGGDRAIWGSLAGRKFKIEAGTRIHYDETLSEYGKPFDYTLESWQEDWFDPAVRPTN